MKLSMDIDNLLSKFAVVVMGDGYVSKTGQIGLTHGEKQKDYLEFKAAYINNVLNKPVSKIYTQAKQINNKTCYIYSCVVPTKSFYQNLRRDFYKGSKKRYKNILSKIQENDLQIFLAIWLGDDGAVGRRVTNNVVNSAHLDIFTCDIGFSGQKKLISWFKEKFKVKPKIKIMRQNKTKRQWYYLSFDQQSSMLLWCQVRNFLLLVPSMKHKFRHIEEKYQRCFTHLEYNSSTSPRQPSGLKI